MKCLVENNSRTGTIIESVIITKTDMLPETFATNMSDIIPTSLSDLQFQRHGFVRTLPVNQHAPTAKLIEAAEKGIELQVCETLVKECVVVKKFS